MIDIILQDFLIGFRCVSLFLFMSGIFIGPIILIFSPKSKWWVTTMGIILLLILFGAIIHGQIPIINNWWLGSEITNIIKN